MAARIRILKPKRFPNTPEGRRRAREWAEANNATLVYTTGANGKATGLIAYRVRVR